jgi:SsrA-binding protein
LGQEIKSIKNFDVSLDGSFIKVDGNNVFWYGANISEYKFSNLDRPDTRRERRLLLHKNEIKKIHTLTDQKGYTIIPVAIGINKKGLAKLDIAVVKGINKSDKREQNKLKEFKKEKRLLLV